MKISVPTNRLWIAGVVATMLVVFVTYWQTADFEYLHFDDAVYILNNPPVRDPGWHTVRWAFTEKLGVEYNPLTWLSYAVEVAVWGLDPGPPHVVNALLHALNCGMVFGILLLLLRRGMPQAGEGARVLCCVAGALFYGLHPLRVESVAWIAERKDVLFAVFYYAATLAYAAALARAGKPGLGTLAACTVLFLLSALSKPMAISLPFVLVLLDLFWRRPIRMNLLTEKLPLFLLVPLVAGVTLWAQAQAVEATASASSPLFRFINAGMAMGFYVAKTLWPVDLVPIYQFDFQFGRLTAPEILSGVAAHILLLLMLGFGNRLIRLSAAFYFITLLPALGYLKSGFMLAADRYTYLPAALFSVWIAAGLLMAWNACHRLAPGRRRAGEAMLATAAVAILAAVLALQQRQIPVWRNSVTLWEHQASVIPNPSSHAELATLYLRQGRLEASLHHYARALQFRMPVRQEAAMRFNFAAVLHLAGHPAESLRQLQTAADLDPELQEAQLKMVEFLTAQGRTAEAEKYRARLRPKP